MKADGGHVAARTGEPDGPAQVEGAGPGGEEQAAHPQALGDPQRHVELGHGPVERAPWGAGSRCSRGSPSRGPRPGPTPRRPGGRSGPGRDRGRSWCRRSPGPGWDGQHGDEGQHGQGRVVDDGPQAAGRAESAVERPVRGDRPGGATGKVGDPTRVIGSVNNRRPAKDSRPHVRATGRPRPGSPDERRTERTRGAGRRSTRSGAPPAGPAAHRRAAHGGGHPRLAARPARRRLPHGDRAPGPGDHARRGLRPGVRVGPVPGRRTGRWSGPTTAPTPSSVARDRWGGDGLQVAQMNALSLGLRPGQLRLGLLLAPHRALRRPRGPRQRAGPGAGRRRDRLLPHPQRPGRLREPLPHPPLRAARAAPSCWAGTSTTSPCRASTPCPAVKADFTARRVKADKVLRARRARPAPPDPAVVVRRASTPGCCPWPTG